MNEPAFISEKRMRRFLRNHIKINWSESEWKNLSEEDLDNSFFFTVDDVIDYLKAYTLYNKEVKK